MEKETVDLRKMEVILVTSSDSSWLQEKGMEVWSEGLNVTFGPRNCTWIAAS